MYVCISIYTYIHIYMTYTQRDTYILHNGRALQCCCGFFGFFVKYSRSACKFTTKISSLVKRICLAKAHASCIHRAKMAGAPGFLQGSRHRTHHNKLQIVHSRFRRRLQFHKKWLRSRLLCLVLQIGRSCCQATTCTCHAKLH